MTNKEAIKYLIEPVATSTEPSEEYRKQKEAYDMAIEALEQTQWVLCSECERRCDKWENLKISQE